MRAKFDATGLLSVAPGREGRIAASAETEEDVVLAVENVTVESIHGTCSKCCCMWNELAIEYDV